MIFQLVAVSAVVMVAAQTLTRERIGEPVRRACGGKERWLGYLVSCPYCASHWFAFALVPLTGTYPIGIAPRWGVVSSALAWLVNALLVVAVAAFLRVAFYFVDESQGLRRREEKKLDVEVDALRLRRDALPRPPRSAPRRLVRRARMVARRSRPSG